MSKTRQTTKIVKVPTSGGGYYYARVLVGRAPSKASARRAQKA